MPTAKPRYTFTDTGDLEDLLDAAQRQWPDISDRKVLLLRLAQEGGAAIGLAADMAADEERRARIAAALDRLPSLVDRDILLSDRAWT